MCSSCEFQIEATLLLRKRVQFASNVWRLCQDRLEGASPGDVKPMYCDNELLLNCHLCPTSVDLQALQSHMKIEHGMKHVRECSLCAVLCGSFVGRSRVEQEDTVIVKQEVNAAAKGHSKAVNSRGMEAYDCPDSQGGDTEDHYDVIESSYDHHDQEDSEPEEHTLESCLNATCDLKPTQKSGRAAAYKCPECITSYQRSNQLRRHMLKHHGLHLPFKRIRKSLAECSVALQERQKSHSEQMPLNSATEDGVAMENDEQEHIIEYIEEDLNSLERQRRTSSSSSRNNRYKCQACDKSYMRTNQLRGHMLKHHGLHLPFQHECDGKTLQEFIDGESGPKEAHSAHKEEEEDEEEEEEELIEGQESDPRFKCPKCESSHCSLQQIRLHMFRAHGLKLAFSECTSREAKLFNRNQPPPTKELSLSQVVKRMPLASRVYPCKECGKTYSRSNKLRAHLMKYHNIKLAFAIKARKMGPGGGIRKTSEPFTDFTLKLIERGGVEVPVYGCTKCESVYQHKHSLQLHVRTHHSVEPDPNTTSDNTLLLSLSRPTLTCSGRRTRTYSCPQCAKQFSRTNLLRKHMVNKHSVTLPFRMRQAIGPHLCHECGKGFTRPKRLTDHMQSHHHQMQMVVTQEAG